MRLAPAIPYILANMTDFYNLRLGAWQRRVLVEALVALVRRRGCVNFTNLARYSRLCEQTFRRHVQRKLPWTGLNLTILRLRAHPGETLIRPRPSWSHR